MLFWKMNVVGTWLRGHETEGLLLYSLAFAVAAGLAFLPSYASSILGGWAFGFAWGFPGALFGFTGGAIIGYGVSTLVTQRRVEEIIESKPRWKAVRDALVGSGFWRTVAIIALVRMPPNSPFALGNLAMASVRVRLLPYVLGTILGMAPRTAFIVWFAANLREQVSDAGEAADKATKYFSSWWYFVGGAAGIVLVIIILSVIAQRTLAKLTSEHAAGRGS